VSVRADGWASDWGTETNGASPATDTGADRLGRAVRELVRQVMGMPAGSVRPANQVAPRGKATEGFATVLLIQTDDAGWTEQVISGTVGSEAQTLTVPRYVTASVQFFKGKAPLVDDAANSVYGGGGFDQASRLPSRLQLAVFVELMRTMRLGFIGASPPRDLTGLTNEQWESRGQVDLHFQVIAAEDAPIGTFGEIGEIDITVETPDGTQHSETIEVNP
jgi:hypothetical protein